ncbi:hypothetical protein [Clostridium saccharoperbutylacetonicum]
MESFRSLGEKKSKIMKHNSILKNKWGNDCTLTKIFKEELEYLKYVGKIQKAICSYNIIVKVNLTRWH